MNSIESEIPPQNITHATEDINGEAIADPVIRKAGLVALACAFLLALSAVASAQSEDLTANPRGFAGRVYTGMIQTAYGPRKVSYQILKAAEFGLEEDLAVFEGDIILGEVSKIKKVVKGDIQKSAGRSDSDFRWLNGVVPYEISSSFSAAEQQLITAALNHWNANTPYWFRSRNGEGDYIRFVRNTNGLCQSKVGRQGGRQDINFDPTQCGTGSAIHEIGHAVGLWHEQARADRNNFVTINWANIKEGKEGNFKTYVQRGEDGRDMFDYDFNSIMHYDSFAFSSNGQATITRLDGTLINAQRNALSQGDIAGAVRLLTNTHGQTQTFKLINVNSGKCLDVANWSRSNNAPVNQFDCHGGANQRWYFWSVPGTTNSLIINDWSGQCLDIPSWSLDNGAPLQQFSCHGFGNQQFRIGFQTYGFRYQNANSGKCLDVPNASTASGVRIQQYTCHSGLNQQWRLQF